VSIRFVRSVAPDPFHRPHPNPLPRGRGRYAGRWLALVVCLLAGAPAAGQDPFADAVHAYTPGTNGGFGADLLPDIVLGPPRGAGLVMGSFDVLALGIGGSIVMRFDLPVICDGPGADFTVFENAFHSGSPTGPLFTEYGYLAVSQDGEAFFEIPYNAASGAGLAGRTAVLSHPDNDISPLDPAVSGGDAFDLADVGLDWAAYVRIVDVADAIADTGDLPQFRIAPNAGFDFDAIAALHACDPSTASTPTPTSTAMAPSATPTAVATETPAAETPTLALPTVTATAPVSIRGDLDGDGRVTSTDADVLIVELYDGDGDAVAAAGGGSIASGSAADVNGDGRITGADLVALARAISPSPVSVSANGGGSGRGTPTLTLPRGRNWPRGRGYRVPPPLTHGPASRLPN
jgi:hypothetical protein